MPAAPAILWLDETESTNTALMARAGELPHGTGLAARRQTAGRGRLGRAWAGAEGNLALSVLLKGIAADALPAYTLGAGVVLLEALDELGVRPNPFALKWPNDVLDGERRKLAGILCEASWVDGSPEHLVVGIGVNVAEAPRGDGVVATCLADHGVSVGVADLADRIRSGLVALDPGRVHAAWSSRSCTLGRQIRIGGVTGRAVGLASDGALQVEQADGAVARVLTGDVHWIEADGGLP
jgi:BirA family biotin operon repressor/biotin-[acetyl-CoA-carboxylase] ligase